MHSLSKLKSAAQVLVFNCDGDFDFKSMGRIFIGLVKCGAWGCFDEFNRLEEGVLSAVSQQVQLIQVMTELAVDNEIHLNSPRIAADQVWALACTVLSVCIVSMRTVVLHAA